MNEKAIAERIATTMLAIGIRSPEGPDPKFKVGDKVKTHDPKLTEVWNVGDWDAHLDDRRYQVMDPVSRRKLWVNEKGMKKAGEMVAVGSPWKLREELVAKWDRLYPRLDHMAKVIPIIMETGVSYGEEDEVNFDRDVQDEPRAVSVRLAEQLRRVAKIEKVVTMFEEIANGKTASRMAEKIVRDFTAVNKFTRGDIVWMEKNGKAVKTEVINFDFNGGRGYTYKVDQSDKPVSETELSMKKPVSASTPLFDGKTPEEFAALWGSTKGQGAAHFYNYGSERQIKDHRFYFTFMNGPGGIKDTLSAISKSLVAKDGVFTLKDWNDMDRFAKFISEESRRAI